MKKPVQAQDPCPKPSRRHKVTLPKAEYPLDWRAANSHFQKRFLAAALAKHDGNKTCAARALGIARRTLQIQIQALELV
ncbi:MAG: hypothetical protein IPG71_00255 [bacterium]|nr:hypothetical protein [bacterium]